MISLSEYLIESKVNGSYIYTINLQQQFLDVADEAVSLTREQYIDAISTIKPQGDEDFKKLIGSAYDLWVESGHEPQNIPFRFDEKGHVKLARMYSQLLNGSKEKVGGVTIVLGDGSVGRRFKIKTDAQETATCMVWNAMVGDANKDKFDITNQEQVKDIIGSLGVQFPKTWIRSFQNQCTSLFEFIHNTLHEDPKNYKASRYNGDEIGKMYARLVDKYIHLCEPEHNSVPRDNYDPTDIILYKEEAIPILRRLITLNTDDSTVLHKYIKDDLFNTKLLMGISLKKVGKVVKVEMFNINKGSNLTKINRLEVDTHNPNSTKVTAWGKFNFSGITNPAQDPEDGDTIQESCITVELRSFGQYMAMDCKSNKGPSLGKVPVRKWTRALGVPSADKKYLSEACHKFAELAKKPDAKEIIQDLIQWGIKLGPWCLPFVLIH